MTFCLFLLIPDKYFAILWSVAIGLGLCFFWFGFRLLVRHRSLLTIPNSTIQSASRGLVEISGLAAGPCTTLAPITQEPCFLYQTTAWQQRDGTKNEWEKVADEALHLPFFIDDSTGQLLIDALGADLELHPRFRGEYASTVLHWDDIPLSVSGFLSRHGIALDRNLLVEERLIKAEDALFVTGTLTENPRVDVRPFSKPSDVGTDHRNPVRHPYRRKSARSDSSEPLPAPEIIRLTSAAAPSSTREMSQQAKIAAALSRAGIEKPQASSPGHSGTVALEENGTSAPISAPSCSEVRREVALREVRPGEARPDEARPDEAQPNTNEAQSSGFNLAPPVVLMKGANEARFVISFRSQKQIAGALAWKAAAMVCGGTAISLLGLYILWLRMVVL